MTSSANKIKQLNNPYLKRKRHLIKKKEVRFSFVSARMKHSLIIVSVSLLAILIACTGLFQAKHEFNHSSEQIKTTKVKLANQQKQNETFKTSVKQLKNTNYVEQVIREKYYYSKPNETIYSLPGDISKDVTQN
ncbi:dihydroorotate dehydrogenase [Philodulcilactobacillus myokoensis]|uniref:Dihydroorotate dehydrogenase n=1 Tax=Philodulcilactobacillus myokoensis TaxID=2929573 RepID=A0A9W6B2H7_9LACO|nr:septum formation initiator family protein [Philodulcilactobacillus myokoensis]GLB47203.1 dihydroorotate dehydrogenase [Philodulcilactobacillus myokoensis]